MTPTAQEQLELAVADHRQGPGEVILVAFSDWQNGGAQYGHFGDDLQQALFRGAFFWLTRQAAWSGQLGHTMFGAYWRLDNDRPDNGYAAPLGRLLDRDLRLQVRTGVGWEFEIQTAWRIVERTEREPADEFCARVGAAQEELTLQARG